MLFTVKYIDHIAETNQFNLRIIEKATKNKCKAKKLLNLLLNNVT